MELRGIYHLEKHQQGSGLLAYHPGSIRDVWKENDEVWSYIVNVSYFEKSARDAMNNSASPLPFELQKAPALPSFSRSHSSPPSGVSGVSGVGGGGGGGGGEGPMERVVSYELGSPMEADRLFRKLQHIRDIHADGNRLQDCMSWLLDSALSPGSANTV